MSKNDENFKKNSEDKSEEIPKEISENIYNQKTIIEEKKEVNQENEGFNLNSELEGDNDINTEELEDLNQTSEKITSEVEDEGENGIITEDIEDFDQESKEFASEAEVEGKDGINIEEIVIEAQNEIAEEDLMKKEKTDEPSLEIELRDFHRNLVEASLYAAGRPLTIEEISNRLEFPKKEVDELINEVAFDYLERSTALVIAQIGDKYQMQIKPEYTEKVSKFAKGGAIAERYLRTLTIIALKQPILKSTVIKLRGSGAYEHVKYLIDNGFIDGVKKGRSQELTTTDKYADMFGLPKDKRQLKQAMITQLGIEEASLEESQVERTEDIAIEPQVENTEDLTYEHQAEIEDGKEEE
ncbi:MAG: SMC-Scp complex subunit ScpB [Promethearchaeota archaeon]|jgi:segregation and condensation protein B